MDKLWWMHITKAHKFLTDIVNTAVGERSIILSLPENVPWRNTLVELVEDSLRKEDANRAFEEIACPDGDVGLFLLDKFCKQEIRATYRYGMSYASFLGKCDDTVLNNRYLWIRDIPENKYSEWVDFIVEYNKNVKGRKPAVFILETYGDYFANKEKKGIKKILFNQNIDEYDKFAFCALAATENSCKEYMRPYLAEMVSIICSEDIELCAECVAAGNKFLNNPVEVLDSIIETGWRSDGSNYSFSKTDDEIKNEMWESQVKTVFPVIEKFRSDFIKTYYKEIKNGLPITNAFNESIDCPEDVELGTLVLMAGLGAIHVTENDYNNLVTFRNARNTLAHLGVLDFNTVDTLLRKKHYL